MEANMEAKTLITNLVEAIEAISKAADESNDVSVAIEDAEETAGLAKLILPSLDAPPAPPPAAMLVVIDADADECYGPFPNDVAAQTFIDTLASVNDVQMMDVKPPANPGGSAPAPAAPQAPQQSYDEVLDDLKAERWRGTPGSVISNKPAGSLYKQ
jgi:hypothetical protein